MLYSIKSFEEFITESGGDNSWRVEVHKTSLPEARKVAEKVLSKHKKTLDDTIPEFDTYYKMLQSAVGKSFGVARRDMPVINDDQIAMFQKLLKDGSLDILKPFAKGKRLTDKDIQHLDDKSDYITLGLKDGATGDDKINAIVTSIPVKDLKPIQEQIFLDKVIAMIGQWGPAKQGGPVTKLTIIVSKDNFILDGHHRFACAMLSDPSLKLSALKVPLGIKELLDVTLAYGDALGNHRNG